jgi:ATP-dependent metalloprotease
MSGADLQNLVNQAAVKASREGSSHVKLSVSRCQCASAKVEHWLISRFNSILNGPKVRMEKNPNIQLLAHDYRLLSTSDRILMGAERKSHFVTDESKRMTAYHEAGHALTALKTAGAMPLHKV